MTHKNGILTLVQCPLEMPPVAAGAGSMGAAEHGLERCQRAPRADRQLLQLQGQLCWFSSPSSFREPRSLAAMGSSLSCSRFFLFERGAEMLGETGGQSSAHSSAALVWLLPGFGHTGRQGLCSLLV